MQPLSASNDAAVAVSESYDVRAYWFYYIFARADSCLLTAIAQTGLLSHLTVIFHKFTGQLAFATTTFRFHAVCVSVVVAAPRSSSCSLLSKLMATLTLQVQRIPKPAASKLVQTQASSESASGQHAAAPQKPSKFKLLQAMNHRGSFGAGFASVIKVNPTAFKLSGSKAGSGGPENGTHCHRCNGTVAAHLN